MEIPEFLRDWINNQSDDLRDGITATELIHGFIVNYRLSWAAEDDATIIINSFEHPFAADGRFVEMDISNYLQKSAICKAFNKRIEELCYLISAAEEAYPSYKFEES